MNTESNKNSTMKAQPAKISARRTSNFELVNRKYTRASTLSNSSELDSNTSHKPVTNHKRNMSDTALTVNNNDRESNISNKIIIRQAFNGYNIFIPSHIEIINEKWTNKKTKKCSTKSTNIKSSYIMWQRDNRHLYKEEADKLMSTNPVGKNGKYLNSMIVTSQILGKVWNSLPIEEKQPYLDRYKREREAKKINL